jgi:hypothetical protein
MALAEEEAERVVVTLAGMASKVRATRARRRRKTLRKLTAGVLGTDGTARQTCSGTEGVLTRMRRPPRGRGACIRKPDWRRRTGAGARIGQILLKPGVMALATKMTELTTRGEGPLMMALPMAAEELFDSG